MHFAEWYYSLIDHLENVAIIFERLPLRVLGIGICFQKRLVRSGSKLIDV